MSSVYCPPCPNAHPELNPLNLSYTVLKAAIQALIVAWPAYKTYKALESNNLRHCKAMLAFWTVTTLMNAAKEFSDEVLGKYSSFLFWKFTILIIKLIPIILSPDYIYSHFIHPFFASHQKSIDSVVEVAETTKQNMIQLPKEGVEKTKEKLEEMKDKIILAGEGVKERLEDIGQQIKETLSPSLRKRTLSPPSGNGNGNRNGNGNGNVIQNESGSEDEDIVELDENGEQVVKPKQCKFFEDRVHLCQQSLIQRQRKDETTTGEKNKMQEQETLNEFEKEDRPQGEEVVVGETPMAKQGRVMVEGAHEWGSNGNKKEL